jgi:hypothetical protein
MAVGLQSVFRLKEKSAEFDEIMLNSRGRRLFPRSAVHTLLQYKLTGRASISIKEDKNRFEHYYSIGLATQETEFFFSRGA